MFVVWFFCIVVWWVLHILVSKWTNFCLFWTLFSLWVSVFVCLFIFLYCFLYEPTISYVYERTKHLRNLSKVVQNLLKVVWFSSFCVEFLSFLVSFFIFLCGVYICNGCISSVFFYICNCTFSIVLYSFKSKIYSNTKLGVMFLPHYTIRRCFTDDFYRKGNQMLSYMQ